ncbi:MAG: outer membrane protein assembly factor, partial [Flavobacteriaceae bacterium]|nr:outer membrane protein assembly factor [Flavobacteriaceae bacterium]
MRKQLPFFVVFFSLIAFSYGQEKRIGTIQIHGLKKTKLNVIKSFLKVKTQEPLDSILLHEDVKRLKRIPSISHAYYKVSESETGSYRIDYFLEENRTLIPVVNFWTTTNKQFAYKIGLYEYNFLGRNMTFGGYYQNNGYHSYALNFKAPYLFSNTLGLAINHQNWTSEEPLYFDNGSANYKYQNISFETLLLYELNFKNKLEFGVNYFKEKYQYKNGITSATIPQELNINKLLYKFVYSYNNLDYFYQYVSGYKNQLFVQMVTTENEFQDDFFIAWNDLFYYKRVGEKGNWANRLRVGLATNNESPFAPFALDNNVNLRGVGILVDR